MKKYLSVKLTDDAYRELIILRSYYVLQTGRNVPLTKLLESIIRENVTRKKNNVFGRYFNET